MDDHRDMGMGGRGIIAAARMNLTALLNPSLNAAHSGIARARATPGHKPGGLLGAYALRRCRRR